MPAFKPAPVVLTIGHSTRTMTYDITSLGFPPWLRLSHYLNFLFLAPLSILTGPAMSPAFTARFPWYLRLFGNRQNARSLHFLALVGYLIFIPIHMGLVIIENFPQKMDQIVLGLQHGHEALAVSLGLAAIALVVVIHVLLTVWSQRRPRAVQHFSGLLTEWLTSQSWSAVASAG